MYAFNVRVSDGGEPSLDDFETITVTVHETNLSPVLELIGGQTVAEGSLLSFTASATDVDLPAENLSFSLDAGAPDGATIDPTTGVFQWTPNESQGPAVYSLTVRVTDDGVPSLEDFETVTITVMEVNRAPELAAIGDQSVDEGSLLTFTAAATDADSPANILSFSLDVGAPDGATIDPNTGEFRWRPPGGTSLGDHSVTVRVSDDSAPSLDDFETITITVNDVNLPPVLSVVDAQSIDEDSQLSFMVSATDQDLPANNVIFSLGAGAPEGAAIDPITGDFRWTPTESQGPAVYAIQVRATDDGTPSRSDVKTIDITVGEVNQTPVLTGIGGQHLDIGSPITFTVSATDADLPANNLVFSLAANAPSGATIDPSTGHFSWTPQPGTSLGSHRVTIRVTDDGVPSRTASTFVLFSTDIFPEINLVGNGQPIVDGDMSPDPHNHTDFGALEVDGQVTTYTYQIENKGNAVLNLTGSPRVQISGPNADDFTVTLQPPASFNFGRSREFSIQFDPTAKGLRTATISIQNNDRYRNPYEFKVQGVGRDPLDVNLDGKVSVVDALAIINQLARTLANQDTHGDNGAGPYNYDANRDGEVSVLDALVVINHLSTNSLDSLELELAQDRVIPEHDAKTPTPLRALEDDLVRLLADDLVTAGHTTGTRRPSE